LRTVSEGPWFFADLPADEYRITAAANGVAFERTVRLGNDRAVIHFAEWKGIEGSRFASK
jgi:hypothetical protein